MSESEIDTKKIQSGCKIIRELKLLFAHLTMGEKSYYKPLNLIDKIVDENGMPINDG